MHNERKVTVEWYRHRDEITHFFECKYIPFDIFGSNLINEIIEKINRKADYVKWP
jgi:hypothetical protein